MKTFKKPEFKINRIDELSEPVFMACSGRELFEKTNWDGYQHQYYEEGRMDARFQVDGRYLGTNIVDRNVFVTYVFAEPVDFESCASDYHTYVTGSGTRFIVMEGINVHLNPNQSIGFGDMYVTRSGVSPDGTPWGIGTQVTLIDVIISFDYHGCV